MKRSITYPLLGVILFLFCWVNLPPAITQALRQLAVFPFGSKTIQTPAHELARLELENHVLRSQIDHVYEWLLSDQRISEQLGYLKAETDQAYMQKRAVHLRKILADQLKSIPAKVTYRDPSSWSSSLWVNVGEKENRSLEKKVVAKNSPVLADGALVGVIEHVGEKQSRVRLITDSGLVPSVRALRGSLQNRELARHLGAFSKQIEKRSDLFCSELAKESFLFELESIQKKCQSTWEDGYLAKGEIHGSSAPFWRSRSSILKGVGFNFDYPDDEVTLKEKKPISILKEGDLLVTTGLDGVFPPNLPVGTVARVEPLQEGGYAYEIEVRPAVNNLNDLETLFVLPPVGE